MPKLILSIAAAGAALAFASPAAAQYFPQPNGYAYGYNGYGNNYGNYGQVQALQARVDALQWRINMLDRRNMISERAAARLRNDSRQIERRLRFAGRNGFNPYEMNDVQTRLARLEQRIQFASSNHYGGFNNGNGFNPYTDGRFNRDDRFEGEHKRWKDQSGDDRDDERDDD